MNIYYVTYWTKGVEQVVERPGNDDDVVDVEPEGQHHCSQTNTWRKHVSVGQNANCRSYYEATQTWHDVHYNLHNRYHCYLVICNVYLPLVLSIRGPVTITVTITVPAGDKICFARAIWACRQWDNCCNQAPEQKKIFIGKKNKVDSRQHQVWRRWKLLTEHRYVKVHGSKTPRLNKRQNE